MSAQIFAPESGDGSAEPLCGPHGRKDQLHDPGQLQPAGPVQLQAIEALEGADGETGDLRKVADYIFMRNE